MLGPFGVPFEVTRFIAVSATVVPLTQPAPVR